MQTESNKRNRGSTLNYRGGNEVTRRTTPLWNAKNLCTTKSVSVLKSLKKGKKGKNQRRKLNYEGLFRLQRDRYGPLAPSVCSVATVLPEKLSHITCHYIFPTIKTLKDYIILNMTTITVFQPQRTYIIFIFLQSCIHHLEDLFGANLMTSS